MRQRKLFDDPAALLEYEFGPGEGFGARPGRTRARTGDCRTCGVRCRPSAGEAASAPVRQARAQLVSAASVALWHFVVQREACGLRDMRQVLRDYRIPPEVAARMGAWPPFPVGRADRPPSGVEPETSG